MLRAAWAGSRQRGAAAPTRPVFSASEDPDGRREIGAANSEVLRVAAHLDRGGSADAGTALRLRVAAAIWAELEVAHPDRPES